MHITNYRLNIMEKHIITLIATPGQPLEQATVQALRISLQGAGATILATITLAESRAYDISYTGIDESTARDKAASIIGNQPIDYIVQPAAYRRKKLLVSDMDSTMIEQECIDELADFIGKKDVIAAITERAMNGELDFRAALKERVAMLAGLSDEALKQTFEKRISLMPGALQLVTVMKKHHAYCVLVSGGFTFFTSKVRDLLGFHKDEANILEIAYGKLTGKVLEPILDKEAKLASLRYYTKELHLDPADTLAIGDGANDLPMILNAGLGVAYHAKPTVRAQARAALNYNDLQALLYAQGYSQQEIDRSL
jgi:phosphoserine phosphatase